MGTHGVAASLLDTFLLFSQPGFPPEQWLGGGAWHRIGAKPAGLEQTGSRARHKHGFGDSGTHRPALSSVGLGQFPQALGLGVGLAPKMGFLLPKGIFQPPRLDETVSKGLGPGLIPSSRGAGSASCLNLPECGAMAGTEHPKPPWPPHPCRILGGGSRSNLAILTLLSTQPLAGCFNESNECFGLGFFNYWFVLFCWGFLLFSLI